VSCIHKFVAETPPRDAVVSVDATYLKAANVDFDAEAAGELR